jgi:hypothetical protein
MVLFLVPAVVGPARPPPVRSRFVVNDYSGDFDLVTDVATEEPTDEATEDVTDEVAGDFDSPPDEFGATTDDFDVETADIFPANDFPAHDFPAHDFPADPGPTETAGDPAGAAEIDVALLDGIERELADVELALARLGDGTYGRCESCGQVLSEDELEASPTGRFCRAHLPLDLS